MAASGSSACCWQSIRVLRGSGRSSSNATWRSFSNTQRSRRHLPTFESSSSQELDALLTQIRERVLLPGLLKPAQKELVFHPKWRRTLENEPVYANIGGEDVQLTPLDRMRDMPNRWRTFEEALKLADTEEDWRNMVQMLEGYNSVLKGKRPGSDRLRMFITTAKEKGQVGKVMECLRNVKKTGASLADRDVLRAVLIECLHTEMADKNYSEEAIQEAWKRAQQVVEMMGLPEHHNPRLNGRPWVIGAILEVCALHTRLTAPHSRAEKDDLEVFMAKFLDCANSRRFLPQEEGGGGTVSRGRKRLRLLEGSEGGPSTDSPLQREAGAVSKMLPMWHGLFVAEEVLGQEYARIDQVRRRRVKAGKRIEECVKKIESALKDSEKQTGQEKIHGPVQRWKALTAQLDQSG